MAVQSCKELYKPLHGCSKLYMAVYCCKRLYIPVYSCTMPYMAVQGCSFMALHCCYGCTRLYMALYNGTNLHMAVRSSTWHYRAPYGCIFCRRLYMAIYLLEINIRNYILILKFLPTLEVSHLLGVFRASSKESERTFLVPEWSQCTVG